MPGAAGNDNFLKMKNLLKRGERSRTWLNVNLEYKKRSLTQSEHKERANIAPGISAAERAATY